MKKLSKKSKLATGIVAFVGSQILASFGNPAFAECAASSDSLCIDTVAICIPENTQVQVTTSNFFGTFPVIISAQQDNPNYPTYGILNPEPDFTIELLHDSFPELEFYNSFDQSEFGMDPTVISGPPTEGISVNREFMIEYTGDIPANTGAIALGNGRSQFNISVIAEGYTWIDALNQYQQQKPFTHDLTVYVDHNNQAPEATNYTTTILNTDRDVAASMTLTDLESNIVNIVYELSTDASFSTITSTASYMVPLSPSGVTHTHIWQDLGIGSYYWRAVATETDSQGACVGFSETEVDPGITDVNIAASLFNVAEAPTPGAGPTLPASGLNAILLTGVAVVMIISAGATWLYSHMSLKKN